jgi:tRNA-intron endonuclease
MINAIISSQSVRSSSAEAFALCDKSTIGEKREGYVSYSPVEALYLTQSGKMTIVSNSKNIGNEVILTKLRKVDSKVEEKCVVYIDMRKRGYVLKEGMKFGGDFRAYRSTEKTHAPWIVQVVSNKDKLNWNEFAAKNRVAHSTHKKILLALVDSEWDVSYYETSWIKP